MPKTKTITEAADPLADLIGEAPDVDLDADQEPELVETLTRAEKVVAALEVVEEQRLEFLNSGRPSPSDALLDGIATLLVEVSAGAFDPWDPSTWPFLAHCTRVAQVIHERGRDWQSPITPWPAHVWTALGAMHECIAVILDPPKPPGPRVIELESLEELTEQKVPDSQIARIFCWFTTDGKADFARVRRARKPGGETPPTKFEAPAIIEGPRRQPSLTTIDQLTEGFLSERAHLEELHV